MAEKGYTLNEEAARRTAEAVRRVEAMLKNKSVRRATGPRGIGGSGGGGRIIEITSATEDGDGYQDSVIADYQSGAGDAIKFYNFNTGAALPVGFYHAELLTSAPAGSPSVPVYGGAYTTC